MVDRTVNDLMARMENIMGIWHPSTRPGNDGDAGNTLEDLLEVPENNLQLPDFGTVEIKTQKSEGGSLLTLFHKELEPRPSVPPMLLALGWRHNLAGIKYDGTEMSFRSTTYGHRYSDRGFLIIPKNGRIEFVYDPEKVNREAQDRTGVYETYGQWADDVDKRAAPNYRDLFPVYYLLGDLIETAKQKLDHTLLVFRQTKRIAGMRHYKYEEAYLFSGIKGEMIDLLIRKGSIAVDFDARTGHNHGTKIRVSKSHVGDLFERFLTMN